MGSAIPTPACEHGRMDASPASIQCSTGPFWTFELEHAFDILAEAGFKEIELMVTRDRATQEPDLPHRLAEERNIKIASIHAPFLVISKTVWGLDPLGKIRRGAEMCRALGCDSMIVHPPYLWERRYARWLGREAEEFSETTGVTVAVETMYPRWTAGRRMRGYRWLEAADLYDSCPTIAMDTSHVTVARQDILDVYSILKDKLVHIHLSDNAGDGRDGHLELEQGVLPIERFLGEIRRTHYRGAISLELAVRKYVKDDRSLVDMLRRNREYVENVLGREEKLQKGMPRTKPDQKVG